MGQKEMLGAGAPPSGRVALYATGSTRLLGALVTKGTESGRAAAQAWVRLAPNHRTAD